MVAYSLNEDVRRPAWPVPALLPPVQTAHRFYLCLFAFPNDIPTADSNPM
jgi:hypothetical protein